MPTVYPITSNVTGWYANIADLQTRFGVANIASWSQLSGSNNGQGNVAVNLTNVQACLNEADSIINSFFQDCQFNIPLPANPGGISGSAPSPVYTTNIWATNLAGVMLYESRGLLDNNPVTGQAYSKYGYIKVETRKEMQEFKSGARRFWPAASRRWPTPSAPFGA